MGGLSVEKEAGRQLGGCRPAFFVVVDEGFEPPTHCL